MTAGQLTFEGGAYPCLNFKAWNSRLVVLFFEVVLRDLCQSSIDQVLDPTLKEELEVASACATAMCAFLDTMEQSGRYLSKEQAESMHRSCCLFLDLYQVLVLLSQRRKQPRWKGIPKHHSWLHLCEDQISSLLNCRMCHSFVDEDFIGVWKKLVLAVPKPLLEYRCLCRYLLRLRVR